MKFLRILLLPLLSVLLVTENQALGKRCNSYLGASSIEQSSKKTDVRVRDLNKQGAAVNIAIKVKIPAHQLINEDLVKRLATKAAKAIKGEGMHAGRDKHNYIKKLTDRYKKHFGGREGVEFEARFVKRTKEGDLIGRLDVIDKPNKVIYDFKFGETGMDANQLAKYRKAYSDFTIKIVNKEGIIINQYSPSTN